MKLFQVYVYYLQITIKNLQNYLNFFLKFSRGAKSVFGCAPAFGCSVFPQFSPFCIKIRRKLAKQVPNKGKMKKNSKKYIFDHLM